MILYDSWFLMILWIIFIHSCVFGQEAKAAPHLSRHGSSHLFSGHSQKEDSSETIAFHLFFELNFLNPEDVVCFWHFSCPKVVVSGCLQMHHWCLQWWQPDWVEDDSAVCWILLDILKPSSPWRSWWSSWTVLSAIGLGCIHTNPV